uniref:EF-hand domain-containing protein 1 n=1 Tax=Cacopsylla melanoneura TaxID=428564 RepID=A0A8D8QUZ7_9HEMI
MPDSGFKQGMLYCEDDTLCINETHRPDSGFKQGMLYCEDDTLCINEGHRPDSGFKQGKLVNRTKHRKSVPNLYGEYYTWKDLNLGMDVVIYGVKYRLCSCDQYTREYLTSLGS